MQRGKNWSDLKTVELNRTALAVTFSKGSVSFSGSYLSAATEMNN